jgi:hypothetical protein
METATAASVAYADGRKGHDTTALCISFLLCVCVTLRRSSTLAPSEPFYIWLRSCRRRRVYCSTLSHSPREWRLLRADSVSSVSWGRPSRTYSASLHPPHSVVSAVMGPRRAFVVTEDGALQRRPLSTPASSIPWTAVSTSPPSIRDSNFSVCGLQRFRSNTHLLDVVQDDVERRCSPATSVAPGESSCSRREASTARVSGGEKSRAQENPLSMPGVQPWSSHRVRTPHSCYSRPSV